MKTPTKLLPTELIAVEVPKDVICWVERDHDMKYYFAILFDNKTDCEYINLESDFEILGEVTADEISFDVEPYVEKNNNGYRNYFVVPNEFNPSFETANESFRSLLQASGLNWVNPLGDYSVALKRHIVTGTWQEAESKRIKGKLIFLKTVK